MRRRASRWCGSCYSPRRSFHGSRHAVRATIAWRARLVLLIAFLKARLIGLEFMELRAAPRVLRSIFEAWTVVACATLLALYLLSPAAPQFRGEQSGGRPALGGPPVSLLWSSVRGAREMSDLGIFNPDLYAKGDPWKSGLPLDLFAELRDDRPCLLAVARGRAHVHRRGLGGDSLSRHRGDHQRHRAVLEQGGHLRPPV